MAAHDAGVEVECPGCGRVVLQKAMIPTLGQGGPALRYLCPACARALIAPVPLESDEVADGTEIADGTEVADGTEIADGTEVADGAEGTAADAGVSSD